MRDNGKVQSLKSAEIKLLQERTRLQRRLEESLGRADWQHASIKELEQERERLELELSAVRNELWKLERGIADE
jgi:chromosome segregation ATPase